MTEARIPTTCNLGHEIHWTISHEFGYCQDPDTGYAVIWRTSPPEAHLFDWLPWPDGDNPETIWTSPEFSRLADALAWAREVIDLESKHLRPPFAPDYRTAMERAIETLRDIAGTDEQGHEGLLWAIHQAEMAIADIKSIVEIEEGK